MSWHLILSHYTKCAPSRSTTDCRWKCHHFRLELLPILNYRVSASETKECFEIYAGTAYFTSKQMTESQSDLLHDQVRKEGPLLMELASFDREGPVPRFLLGYLHLDWCDRVGSQSDLLQTTVATCTKS